MHLLTQAARDRDSCECSEHGASIEMLSDSGKFLLDNCPRCTCLTLGSNPDLESADAQVYLHRTP